MQIFMEEAYITKDIVHTKGGRANYELPRMCDEGMFDQYWLCVVVDYLAGSFAYGDVILHAASQAPLSVRARMCIHVCQCEIF